MTSFYFDGSDAAVTDPNNAWTNDSNLTDTIETSLASCGAVGSASSNYLMVEGTNAPGSGKVIAQVKTRNYSNQTGDSTGQVNVYTDSLGELLGFSILDSFTTGWSPYSTLSTPSGGWTWAKVQALEIKAFYTDKTGGGSDLGKVEILVEEDPVPSRIYRIQGFQ